MGNSQKKIADIIFCRSQNQSDDQNEQDGSPLNQLQNFLMNQFNQIEPKQQETQLKIVPENKLFAHNYGIWYMKQLSHIHSYKIFSINSKNQQQKVKQAQDLIMTCGYDNKIIIWKTQNQNNIKQVKLLLLTQNEIVNYCQKISQNKNQTLPKNCLLDFKIQDDKLQNLQNQEENWDIQILQLKLKTENENYTYSNMVLGSQDAIVIIYEIQNPNSLDLLKQINKLSNRAKLIFFIGTNLKQASYQQLDKKYQTNMINNKIEQFLNYRAPLEQQKLQTIKENVLFIHSMKNAQILKEKEKQKKETNQKNKQINEVFCLKQIFRKEIFYDINRKCLGNLKQDNVKPISIYQLDFDDKQQVQNVFIDIYKQIQNLKQVEDLTLQLKNKNAQKNKKFSFLVQKFRQAIKSIF
ncbi:hypothetical protein PPERSA_02445 [Pseudocohnilembus persalinus]|uniref:Uncharacterized protein n=1 Tax=Pseudocohnilembus persalinus TaxID=266149 RepID=A0A0V0QAU0_PSEPJ|nr:hypothetical protein PPERSA_02445 [Pseudocohnilembus persalinus]|eukprot:KRW99333.1 hypothetical protein PPERSA_02445 [Pseudocohnilembus persalinus]